MHCVWGQVMLPDCVLQYIVLEFMDTPLQYVSVDYILLSAVVMGNFVRITQIISIYFYVKIIYTSMRFRISPYIAGGVATPLWFFAGKQYINELLHSCRDVSQTHNAQTIFIPITYVFVGNNVPLS